MDKEYVEFWSGLGKGIDLSLEVLNEELNMADESVKPVILRLKGLLIMQRKRVEVISS